MTDLVSVIITTYGRTIFLETAILSVLNQTYKNIEILVIDDNANFPEIRSNVKSIVLKYPQCKLVLNRTNLGGALSRNEGIIRARGVFISFLDDDDTYEPDRIKKNIDAYFASEKKNIGLIYTYCNSIDENGKIIGEYKIDLQKKPLYQHMMSCLCATSQWFIPKNIFKEVGIFEDTPCKQDSIMLLKILGKGYDVVCIPEKLSNYREHNLGRISGNYARNLVGRTNLRNWCRKYYFKLTPTEIKNVEGTYAFQLCFYNAMVGKRKEAYVNLIILLKNKWKFKDVLKCLIWCLFGKTYLILKR